MIKFSGDGKNGKVYIFGLSRGNIDRLTAGQPIKVNLADMGGPSIEIAILFGETERKLFDDLREAKMLPPDVEYREAAPGMAEVVRIKRK